MRVLKTKTFARWARREGVADSALRAAVREMRDGLVDANLGGGVVKKRVARPGGGKSGGYRTILATNLHDRWFFLFGFAKSERDDIDEDELRALKRLAHSFLGMDQVMLDRLLEAGELLEINHGKPQTS